MAVISVIIPLFNKEQFIKKTLLSVLNQTFSDFEILLINDGSTDGSIDIVTSFDDERITLYTTKNKGVSHARNYGISKSNSDLIAFLDADDLWESNHLENLHRLYTSFPNCGLYATAYSKQFFNGKKMKAHFNGVSSDHFGVIEDYFLASIIDSIAWTSAVLIPKKTILEIGGFDEEMRSGQDTDLWVRIALKKLVAFSAIATSNKIILEPKHHLSYSSSRIDRMKLFENFKDLDTSNISFKKYMDLNRFSVAIERKIAGDSSSYRQLKKEIDPLNLNYKQRVLLNTPPIIIGFLKQFQNVLLRCNIYLSPYKKH
ncbi:glycosyltransferase family 2 protein [Flavobacteriaceae bacterium]|jgi:glycosyltransferase involved in cell wall biosynthesis|nr:glycosyltransferase family 2 protein [Flavobacteriaceae bacterium]